MPASNSDRAEAEREHWALSAHKKWINEKKKWEKPPSNTWYGRRYVHAAVAAACVYDVSNTSQYMQNICLQLVTRKRKKKNCLGFGAYYIGTYVENSLVYMLWRRRRQRSGGGGCVRRENSFDSNLFFFVLFHLELHYAIASTEEKRTEINTSDK